MSLFSDLLTRLSAVTPSPKAELALLTEAAIGLPSDLFSLLSLTGDLPSLTAEEEEKLCSLVSRRCAGEPLQYITGRADFYGRSFAVAEGVLIPRFDTEILIDTALPLLQEGDAVLDLCAGTGCIGLTLGAEKNLRITEVEKYDGAFALLEKNAATHLPSATLLKADLFTLTLKETFDAIVSNPPYIPTGDLQTLSPEVQREPVTALDGGEDGLIFYRTVLHRFTRNLKDGGYLFFECGISQAPALFALFSSAGYENVTAVKDYGRIDRVVYARKPKGAPSHV